MVVFDCMVLVSQLRLCDVLYLLHGLDSQLCLCDVLLCVVVCQLVIFSFFLIFALSVARNPIIIFEITLLC